MKNLEIIKELMQELIEEMEATPDEFDHRLGRKKPDVKVLEIKGEVEPLEEEEEELEEVEPEEDALDEDDLFRKRLLKLRK